MMKAEGANYCNTADANWRFVRDAKRIPNVHELPLRVTECMRAIICHAYITGLPRPCSFSLLLRV
jgi:hypothetical protein